MRRIARLRKPSGWKCPTPRHQSIAQCAATPLTAAARPAATCASSLRFYSQNSSLPRSLTDTQPKEQPESEQIQQELEQAELELAASKPTRAFRPPPPRMRAKAPHNISDSSYTPAETSEGLLKIGGLEDWWDRRENWDKAADFSGFKAKKKIQDPRVLETAVRRAVVEATVLVQSGETAELRKTWPIGSEQELSKVLALNITSDAQGNASLAGDHGAVVENLRSSAQASGAAEKAEHDSVPMPSTQEADAFLESWDPSWKSISLADATVKFAITKRVFQLTGQLIPDHKLNDIKTVYALVAALKAPPKAQTLTRDIQETRQDLVGLPNVAFSSKQVTRGDKAKSIGQYKIVEEEFKKRNLQDGHLAVAATKEKHWFQGRA